MWLGVVPIALPGSLIQDPELIRVQKAVLFSPPLVS